MRKAIAGVAAAILLLVAILIAVSVISGRAQQQKVRDTQRGWITDDLANLAEAKQALETKFPNWKHLSDFESEELFTLKTRVKHHVFAYNHHLSYYEMCQKEAIPKEEWVIELEKALGRAEKSGPPETPAPAADTF